MSAWFETLEWGGTLRSKWDEAAGVTLLAPLTDPEETWDRETVSNTVVDGEFETHSSLGRMLLPMRIVVRGASRAQAHGRYLAIKADVYATSRLLLRTHVDGIETTYRAYRPDVTPLDDLSDIRPRRDVLLTWRVLPHPTITGTEV